jgi:FkbM family methyltransferase
VRLSDLLRRRPANDASFPIDHEGHRFQVPSRPGADYLLDRMRRKRSFYELDLLTALRAVAPPGGAALDVGANIGNHTLYFAGVMGLRTWAFEPMETNLAVLRRLVALNGLSDRVEIVPIALSDAPGALWLAAPDPNNPGTFRAVAGERGDRVEAIRLDDALDRFGLAPGDVSLLKIDVEGHEEQVLAGAPRLLADGGPIVAVEVFDPATFDRLTARLGPLGYRAAAVHCATPTVIFRRGSADAEETVRARIEADAARARA